MFEKREGQRNLKKMLDKTPEKSKEQLAASILKTKLVSENENLPTHIKKLALATGTGRPMSIIVPRRKDNQTDKNE